MPKITSIISEKHKPDDVGQLSVSRNKLSEKWDLIDDLLGGTRAMRDAKTKWLPQEPREEYPAYINRIERSFLFPALEETIKDVVARPFNRQVILNEEDKLPEQLQDISANVDRAGRNLTQLCRDVLNDALAHGLSHVLVDFPNIEGINGDRRISKAEERKLKARPVFVHVPAVNILGWQTEVMPTGEVRLSQVRIHEFVNRPAGQFGEEVVEQIRVFTTDAWSVFIKGEDDEEFHLIESGTHTFGAVPLFTYYTNRTDVMMADPPFENLAWLNLAHWQSSSDQRNILRFARSALLFAKGLTDSDMQDQFSIGPGALLRTTSSEADMKFVEHTGAGIEAGEKDLQALEERMQILGMKPFVERSQDSTATGRLIDEARDVSDAQAWVSALEQFIVELYEAAAQWVKKSIPENFVADINNDFGFTRKSAEEMSILLKSRQSGEITQERFLIEGKRRGILSEETDVDKEVRVTASESPAIGAGRDLPTGEGE